MAAVEKFVLYHYDPSLVAAVVFIALFGLSALLHLFQLVRYRTWYFIPFLIGCCFEAIGYVGRALSARETPDWTTTPYVMQSLLLLLGPTLLAASIYMVLGRLVRLLEAEAYSIIKPKWLTKFFVLGDVISFLVQSAGGGMLSQAKTQDAFNRGQYIIVGGLGVQIIFFGFFMVVTCIFHYRTVSQPTSRSYSLTVPWRAYIFVLYVASVFIMIRSVFRVVEYITGSDGVLQSTEVYLYIFDASLMFIVAALFNVFHPSRIINNRKVAPSAGDYESQAELGVIDGHARNEK